MIEYIKKIYIAILRGKTMKKLLPIILCLALLVSVMALATSCGPTTPEPCDEHIDTDGNRVCDVCKELMLDLPKDVTVSFTVKDQDGAIVPGVEVTFTSAADATKKVTATGNAEGKLTATLTEGNYRVSYDYDVDEIGYYLTDTSSITVDEGVTDMVLNLINNNPNGTAERPYTLVVGDNNLTLPANTSYYYVVYRAINLIADISGDGIKVTYRDTEYTTADGAISFSLLGEDTNSVEVLLIENTTDAEATASVTIASTPGSSGNPFIIEANGDVTAEGLTKDDIIYYTYTAKAAGEFTITVTSENSYVAMINSRNSVATNTTSAASNTITLTVEAGDEIIIDCAVTKDSTTAVTFTVELVPTAD